MSAEDSERKERLHVEGGFWTSKRRVGAARWVPMHAKCGQMHVHLLRLVHRHPGRHMCPLRGASGLPRCGHSNYKVLDKKSSKRRATNDSMIHGITVEREIELNRTSRHLSRLREDPREESTEDLEYLRIATDMDGEEDAGRDVDAWRDEARVAKIKRKQPLEGTTNGAIKRPGGSVECGSSSWPGENDDNGQTKPGRDKPGRDRSVESSANRAPGELGWSREKDFYLRILEGDRVISRGGPPWKLDTSMPLKGTEETPPIYICFLIIAKDTILEQRVSWDTRLEPVGSS
ncbi:hypothetical protein KM043_008309 [Ampulex compressa]|nr:hypothetical protein KM043_008309 [Ampulex compressa]